MLSLQHDLSTALCAHVMTQAFIVASTVMAPTRCHLQAMLESAVRPVRHIHEAFYCHEPLNSANSFVQGLADAFILLGMPFDSPEAKQLNKEIFEAIYFAALETSTELAKADGVWVAP